MPSEENNKKVKFKTLKMPSYPFTVNLILVGGMLRRTEQNACSQSILGQIAQTEGVCLAKSQNHCVLCASDTRRCAC